MAEGTKDSLYLLVLQQIDMSLVPEGSRLKQLNRGCVLSLRICTRLLVTAELYISSKVNVLQPSLFAEVIILFSFPFSTCVHPLNQHTIQKDTTDSTIDLQKRLTMVVSTFKYFNLRTKYIRWIAFLQIRSAFFRPFKLLSMTVPKYLYVSTVSTG